MGKNNLKGISPVIATILMVMITVGLVAFSYTWFTQMGQQAQQQTETQISQMDKARQSFDIPTAYYNNNYVNFEFRASALNTLNIPANQTYIKVYIDNAPKSLETWNGGISGTACLNNANNLAPGESCYGRVNIGSCPPGAVRTLKISHTWGAVKEVSVRCS